MFLLAIKSILWVFTQDKDSISSKPEPAVGKPAYEKYRNVESQILRNMAAAQLALVLVTLFTAHVQIITRISSAYPVWMWYAAAVSTRKGDSFHAGLIVKFEVMYAIIQGGLFASFLPPA